MLTRDHFEKVSKVSDQFNNYLWSIQSKTDAERASAWGIRHDHWSRPGEGFNAAPGRRPRADSIDGGLLSFGRASPYQAQMMPSPMQPFPSQPAVSMGAQPAFQGQYQHGQTQFGQPQMMTQTSSGASFEQQQPGFIQQPQPQQRLEPLPSYTQQRQQQMQVQDSSRSGGYIG